MSSHINSFSQCSWSRWLTSTRETANLHPNILIFQGDSWHIFSMKWRYPYIGKLQSQESIVVFLSPSSQFLQSNSVPNWIFPRVIFSYNYIININNEYNNLLIGMFDEHSVICITLLISESYHRITESVKLLEEIVLSHAMHIFYLHALASIFWQEKSGGISI